MKGYLTVFLSLSLTLFLSLFLGLIGGALQNLGRMKIECATDIGMNSLLGEFHRELLVQYDLLFVDISYGSEWGDITNVEEHLKEYMRKNIHSENQGVTTWNELRLEEANISDYVLASDDAGLIMQEQACAYMKDSDEEDTFSDLQDFIRVAQELDSTSGMEAWSSIMEQIETIELPMILNSYGEREEIPLDNPATPIFDSACEQIEGILYAGGNISAGNTINGNDYLSHRSMMEGTGKSSERRQYNDKHLFQAYLFQKYGRYGAGKEASVLRYQIEYLIAGEDSDIQNLTAVVKRIFNWRFNDNIRLYLKDDSKRAEAEDIAESLPAVGMKREFKKPVTESILYAWAFIDSVYDTGLILGEGQIPLIKEEIDVIGTGLCYQQYLWLMLNCESQEMCRYRAMDIMEMDIRITPYNEHFRMDWCLESCVVKAAVSDRFGSTYSVNRKYGYY